MAKLKDVQERCDKKKYVDSYALQQDLSGSMDYCEVCKYSLDSKCVMTHDQRVADNLCARAYNKLHKGNKNG